MDALEVRAATQDDADAVAAYHDRCFAKTYSAQLLAGELAAPDPQGTRRQLQDWFQPGSEFETRVAVDDGVPIAHFTVAGWTVTDRLIHTVEYGISYDEHILIKHCQ